MEDDYYDYPFYMTRDKWTTYYDSIGIKRKNGYITTAERNKARKKHKKKK